MPCIISWAPALRARPPQDVGQSLLTVALRRLTEPSTRKIAAQEPPSSAGHNDVPHADLARVSMGRDAGQGAYSDARAVVLGRPLAVSAVAAGPVRLAAHRRFMVIVKIQPESSSRKPREAERCDIPPRSYHMALISSFVKATLSFEARSIKLGHSTVGLSYF